MYQNLLLISITLIPWTVYLINKLHHHGLSTHLSLLLKWSKHNLFHLQFLLVTSFLFLLISLIRLFFIIPQVLCLWIYFHNFSNILVPNLILSNYTTSLSIKPFCEYKKRHVNCVYTVWLKPIRDASK